MNLKLIIAWLFVGIPLGWGMVKSVQQALPLFTGVKAAMKAK
jgi:hypothetical protein